METILNSHFKNTPFSGSVDPLCENLLDFFHSQAFSFVNKWCALSQSNHMQTDWAAFRQRERRRALPNRGECTLCTLTYASSCVLRGSFSAHCLCVIMYVCVCARERKQLFRRQHSASMLCVCSCTHASSCFKRQ